MRAMFELIVDLISIYILLGIFIGAIYLIVEIAEICILCLLKHK